MKLSKNQKIGLSVLGGLLLLSFMFRKKIVTAWNSLTPYLYDRLKFFEGIIKDKTGNFAVAYKDATGTWTIGYGNTFYTDGTPVKNGDKITLAEAETLFKSTVATFAKQIEPLIIKPINNNQFTALILFAYNVGLSNFTDSTLLKKINNDPLDASIYDEFLRWNKSKGVVLAGLTKRRKEEADLYFKPI